MKEEGPKRSACVAAVLAVSLCGSACIPVRTTTLEGGASRAQFRRIDDKADLWQRFGDADAETTDGRFALYSLRKEAEWTVISIEGEGEITSSEVGTTHVLLEFDAANLAADTHFHHCDDDSDETFCRRDASEQLYLLIGELRGSDAEARQRMAEPQHAALAGAMHQAASAGDAGRIRDLLAQGASVSAYIGGIAPMHRAAEYGRIAALAYLAEAGVPIDTRHGRNSKTPLHLAASEGELETVDWLLAQGADLDAADLAESTPLRDAVQAGRVDVALRLIDAGANVNAGESDLLSAATARGNLGLVEALVDHGADIHSKGGSSDGAPPLYYAVERGDIAIASLLLENGANPATMTDRYDPLHTAIDHRDIAMVRLLLEHGANPYNRVRIPGQGAVTPARRARLRGEDEIADLIEEHASRD